MTNPNTNPVGYLQEFVQKYNCARFPEYIETGAVGPAHSRLFTCHCLFDGHDVEAKSNTKKHAKTESARLMIVQLTENGYLDSKSRGTPIKLKSETSPSQTQPSVTSLNKTEDSVHSQSPSINCFKNPISLLQEYCQGKHINLPVYVEGGNATAGFIVECELQDKKTSATGSNKKMAKTEAATRMCQELGLNQTSTATTPDHSLTDKTKVELTPISVLDRIIPFNSEKEVKNDTLKRNLEKDYTTTLDGYVSNLLNN